MCNVYAYAAMVAVSAYGSLQGAGAEADEYEASADSYEDQAEIYDEKAKVALKESNLSEVQAMDSLSRGKVSENKFRMQGQRLVGSQRASFGASGVRVDTGVAEDVRVDTERAIEGDAITIRSNFVRESYGFKLNAWRQRGESRSYSKSAVNSRRAAENMRKQSEDARNRGPFEALVTAIGGAANYQGK